MYNTFIRPSQHIKASIHVNITEHEYNILYSWSNQMNFKLEWSKSVSGMKKAI